ncbi:MAG: response regulator [Gemmatimonadetes bacterium]|nr:response regulator [Gemmatimonadota bacterium]
MATVLLIDDDEKTRNVLKRRLVVEGYQVVEAIDGEGALAQYRHFATDLVMAGLRLPGMTGEQLIGDLKRAHGDVRKPFTSDQLLDALGGAMARAPEATPVRGAWNALLSLFRVR